MRPDERGFSLIELLIVTALTATVVGGAVALSSNVQRVYSYELNDAGVQQEARFVLDWITRVLAPAGSNPYNINNTDCPAPGTAFAPLRFDPNGNGIDDDVRVQADVNPPNQLLGGLGGACNEAGEDITIAHDPVNRTITRRDMVADPGGAVAVTDGVFSRLRFTYLDRSRVVTANPNAVAYVQIALNGLSRSRNPYTGQFTTFTYQSEVRMRTR